MKLTQYIYVEPADRMEFVVFALLAFVLLSAAFGYATMLMPQEDTVITRVILGVDEICQPVCKTIISTREGSFVVSPEIAQRTQQLQWRRRYAISITDDGLVTKIKEN